MRIYLSIISCTHCFINASFDSFLIVFCVNVLIVTEFKFCVLYSTIAIVVWNICYIFTRECFYRHLSIWPANCYITCIVTMLCSLYLWSSKILVVRFYNLLLGHGVILALLVKPLTTSLAVHAYVLNAFYFTFFSVHLSLKNISCLFLIETWLN